MQGFLKNIINELQDKKLVLNFCLKYGGQRIYIPKKLTATHKLNEFGSNFMELICNTYGGEEITIPVYYSHFDKSRKLKAEIMIKAGYSTNEIAKALKYSNRNIQYQKAKIKTKVHIN